MAFGLLLKFIMMLSQGSGGSSGPPDPLSLVAPYCATVAEMSALSVQGKLAGLTQSETVESATSSVADLNLRSALADVAASSFKLYDNPETARTEVLKGCLQAASQKQ